MKKLVELFIVPELKKVHLTKDVGLVPYYLAKIYNLKAEIVFTNKEKEELPKNFRNIELTELPYINLNRILKKFDKFKIFENWNFLKYLYKNSKNIDILLLFHFNKKKIPIVLLYKLLNKNGKIYMKMDIEINTIQSKNQKNFFKKYYGKILAKNIDVFSCETKECYNKIKNSGFWRNDISSKLLYIPNGVDEEKIKEFDYKKKENIIITVGRLGTYQKNTEMLLKSLENLDLREWKILLIGPYTQEFEKKYLEFIKNDEIKKNKIILIGNIEEREKLYEIYAKSKCFVLTSRYESFGIVLVEASRFGNYIITTKVGGAEDIIKNKKIGEIIESEDSQDLKKKLKKIIEEERKLEPRIVIECCKENFIWEKILKNTQLEKILFK